MTTEPKAVSYVGSIVDGGDAGSVHTVEVHYDDGDVRLLEHHVRHSPGGFSWGYGGSGPADLARSIVWDRLGVEPHPQCYQAFKFAFVAGWPQGGGFELSADDVDAWLERFGRCRLVPSYSDDETTS